MSKKIQRILIIAPTPYFADRGCHVHILEQARALQRQGKEVKIVTYGVGRTIEEIPTKRTIRFPWYNQEAIGPSWHKFYVDIFLFFTALHEARKFKPDIIHGHLHEGALIGSLVSRLTGIALVFDCQGSLTGELIAHNFPLIRSKALRNVWYALEQWIDHLPQVILAQSTEMQTELRDKFGVDSDKIFMAYDGVNTQVFLPNDDATALRKELKIPANRRLITYLGGLTKHKGVDILMSAFAQVHRKMPETYLLLMGYPNEQYYQQKVQEMGLVDAVCITGKVPYEQAPHYLALGEIAVAPKRTQTEANGKIYNYMAAGLPVVAFDTIVNRDILGDLGVYVGSTEQQADNGVTDLANTMIELLQNPQRLKQLAEDVHQRAVDKYSWDDVVRRITKAYQSA